MPKGPRTSRSREVSFLKHSANMKIEDPPDASRGTIRRVTITPRNDAKETPSKPTLSAAVPTRSKVTTEQQKRPLVARTASSEDSWLEEARSRALAALNRRLPRSRPSEAASKDVPPETDQGSEDEASSSSHPRCRCLRRGGVCTCEDDTEWLRSKRPQASRYAPPYLRARASQLPAEGPSEKATSSASPRARLTPASLGGEAECTCLRRHGVCSCRADAQWLQRKRRCIVPYVPPFAKTRQDDLDRKRVEIAAKEAEPVESRPAGPSIRTLARRWESCLEHPGACRFNPLQTEGQMQLCEDAEGLETECLEQTFAGQGVKALPVVQKGRYHFEVELLRDSALAIGWSSAMSLASSWDQQAFGFSSEGLKLSGHASEEYASAFGKAGDVVGALASWTADVHGRALHISFMLNGQFLGTAFRVGDDRKIDVQPVPLQPQVSQLPSGLPLHVRLRGLSASSPLKFPREGFSPLSEMKADDFCPFSRAVAEASTERVAASLSEEQLVGFCLPDAHVLELYDLPEIAAQGSDAWARQVSRSIAERLKLPSSALSSPMALFVKETSSDFSTALVAFRRAAYAQMLSEAAAQGEQLPLLVRPLRHATATSREKLREWRGDAYRPKADPSAARRLIHGSLQSQMPLGHLLEEKQKRKST